MIKYLSKVNAEKLGGVALLRLDFNTKDDWRMRAALPVIQLLLKTARAVVILSHKGRPLGFQKEFSLVKDAANLGILLKKNVQFLGHFNFTALRSEIAAGKPKSVFVIENLRFMPGEADNNKEFAMNLASLGDYYVNDAFAVSHRKNASVSGIAALLPSYAGLGLESEIKNLGKIMGNAKRPLVMIFGGAKVEDKLDVLHYFKRKADAFLLGGALANTLLHLKGTNVGKSLHEQKVSKEIEALIGYKNIFLPVDYRSEGNAILDIGAKTEKMFAGKISEAKTIVWNGPVGMVEKEEFAKGTAYLARAIAANKNAFSVVGGGETVMALKRAGLDGNVSFISTGGGAMLDYLAGKKLPGITALEKSK